MDAGQSPLPGVGSLSPQGDTAGSDRLFGPSTSLSPQTSRLNINSAGPMPFRNASIHSSAPPPLPPPRAFPDLDKGRDLSWEYANSPRRDNALSRPVSPLSSPLPERKGSRANQGLPRMQVASRRQSSVSTLRSPSSADYLDPERDEGYGSLSGTSITQLQGERPLDRQNRKNSSHAYDKSVLSKIGGPRTPTRASTSSTTSSIDGNKPLQLRSLSISDSQGGSTFESPVSSKWPLYSPQSAIISPSFGNSAASPRSLIDPHQNLTLDTKSIVSSTSGSASASASASGSTGGGAGAEAAPDTRFNRIEPRRTQRSESSGLSRMIAFSSAGNPSSTSSLPLTSPIGTTSARGRREGAAAAAAAAAGIATGPGPPSDSTTAGGLVESGRGHKRVADPGRSSVGCESRLGLGGPGRSLDSQAGRLGGSSAATTTAPALRPQTHHHLRLDERVEQSPPTFTTPSYSSPSSGLQSTGARQSMTLGNKRKASSPARGSSLADKSPPQTTKVQQLQRPSPHSTSAAKRGSNLGQTSYAHPPVSSNSSASTVSNGSYAPPASFAVGTSGVSSSPHDSLRQFQSNASAASSEPTNQLQSSYASSTHFDSSLTSDDPNYNAQLASSAQMTAAAAQKFSADNASRIKQGTQPKIHMKMHICDCCPKKPKKFDTYEELRQHQNEKQYTCEYCQNRFKNKNEMERHKNSLHLRRHSWSCATLQSYEEAFHPCTAVPPNTGNTNQQQQQPPPPLPQQQQQQQQQEYAPYDVCGYCGQQFPNTPSPDLVTRSNHLTEFHKFKECNQSKKFFRADHFRQHLKHSHGGTSGKWTNMLETACMRDEPPVTAEAQAQAQSAQALATAQQQASQGSESKPAQTASPHTETMQQPQTQRATPQAPMSQLPGNQLQGTSAANMMQAGHYPMVGGMGLSSRGSAGGGDFHFATIQEDTKHQES